LIYFLNFIDYINVNRFYNNIMDIGWIAMSVSALVYKIIQTSTEIYKPIVSRLKTHLDNWGFIEVAADPDGLYSGFILPPQPAMFLWKLSCLSFISGSYAIVRGHYTLAPVPLGVCITSLNYWRHPTPNSMRRKIDIGYVNLALVYQIYRAVNAQYVTEFWIITLITLSFFPLGVWLNNYSAWLGTLSHSMVHIGGNIANIVLYAGTIVPIQSIF